MNYCNNVVEISTSKGPCKFARYCRHHNPKNNMCMGEENNTQCTAAWQFRLYNDDHCIDDESVNIEAKFLL